MEEDILEYRNNDPVGYKALSELKDSKGQVIYVYIGRKDICLIPGATYWDYHNAYKQFFCVVDSILLNDAFLCA
ncbi:hypothetical protein [Paraflavitalea speifideaquila]|uniref:hypothetical protein n=1 Tax=Paraflavitalea speifideaquila TaxID=3076558 RepID=UPI0028EA0056|nr:hypothetical protein [Paraflavitalea speifideiaquila]